MATNLCLSCDSVFDVLTRGPYPAVSSEANRDDETNTDLHQSVDQHLAACHDCRKIAEALRPATRLIHEVMSAEAAAGLPVFRTDLPQLNQSGEMTLLVDRPAEALTSLSSTGRAVSRSNFIIRFATIAACLLVGCIVGFGLRGGPGSDTPPESSGGVVIFEQGDSPNMVVVTDLAQLNLDEQCHRQVVYTQHPTEGELNNEFDCCTRCHRSHGDTAATNRTTVIASSCVACHIAPRS